VPRRRWKQGFGLAALLLLALAVWVGWQAVHVRRDLATVQSQVRRLRAQATAGDYVGARRTLTQVRAEVSDAAYRTGDPAWRVGAAVPVLGRDLSAVRRGAEGAQQLATTVLPDVERLTELVQQHPPLQGGAVQLDTLPALEPLVDRSSAAAARVRKHLAAAPRPLLPQVRSGLASLDTQVAQLDDALRSAASTLRVMPAMLGADGPRRYFVAVQNNAEARATGGLVGAYAIVTADRGRLNLDRAGSDNDFKIPATPIRLPADASRVWKMQGLAQYWYYMNLTPHLPDVATALAGMWTAQSGQHLDGVLLLDPIAMAELLRPSGPVGLPGGVRVGPNDVADFVMHREYVLFDGAKDQAPRKQLVSALAGAVFHSVLAGGHPTATLSAVSAAVQSGHLQLWSAHASEQAVLRAGIVGGALPKADSPYLQVLTQNFGGDKLDYYVRRQVRVTRVGDGRLRVEVQLRNVVPPGLPTYMTVRSDHPQPPVPVGQARLGLSVYGALSSRFDQVQRDGATSTMVFDTDHGHAFGTLLLELPPGATRTVSVLVTEPRGRLDYRQQPLAYPDALQLEVPHRVIGR